jgi:CheY-like chemotaxis protein
VYADPTQVDQAITNLALNARDAMPDGGTMRLRASIEHVDHLTPTSTGDLTPGDWVCISVQDSGEGIEHDVLPRIFEPFFTTKPIGRGSGLGLATVFAIAQQLGGAVTVRSTIAEGSEFQLFLPLVVVATAPVDSVREQQRARADECILLVEDELSVRRVVERLLGASGYRLLLAHNGDDALEVMRTNGHEVSLVLSDVMMPKMGGVSLVEVLRERYPSVPVILMSGFGETDAVQRQLAHDDVAFVQKPFTARELLGAIQSALAARITASASKVGRRRSGVTASVA